MTDFWNKFKELTIGTQSGSIPVVTYLEKQFKQIFLYPDKNIAYGSFEHNLMLLKAIFFVMIIVMAIYYPVKYHSTGLVTQKPLLFLGESTVFALSGVVPFLMLYFLRNKQYTSKDLIKYCIVLFIGFFALNYLLELSGFYAYSFDEQKSKENKQCTTETCDKFLHTLDISLRSVFILVCGLLLVMMVISLLFIHDTRIDYNFGSGSLSKWGIFSVETILFGALSAVSIYLVAKDRHALNPKNTSEEFGIIMLKFMLVNIGLQLSGFYNHFFTKDYSY